MKDYSGLEKFQSQQVIKKYWEKSTGQLQNAGPLLNIHQTSRLVWLGSGWKNEE